MKTVFALLGLCFNALAIELFLLPDHGSDALYFFNQTIKKSTSEVTLLSREIDSESLEKSIVDLAKREIGITIVVAPEHAPDISYPAQYRTVTLKTLAGLDNGNRTGRIEGSLIISDDREACLSSTSLTQQGFRQNVAIAECYIDDQHLKSFRRHADTLVARAKAYLE